MLHLTSDAQKSTPSIYRFIAGMYSDMDKQGLDLIKFTLGDPTEPVHPSISDAGIVHYLEGRGLEDGQFTKEQILEVANILKIDPKLLEGGPKTYTPFPGDGDARESVAEAFNSRHGTNYSSENVIMTTGANGAINLATFVLEGPYVVHEPGFGVYPPILNKNRKEGISFDTTQDNFAVKGGAGEKLDRVIEELYKAKKADNPSLERDNFTFTFLFTDPGNPTGYKHSKEELESIRDLFLDKWKGENIISDSLYMELSHDKERAISILDISVGTELEDRMVFVDSISKIDSASSSRGGYAISKDSKAISAMANEQLKDAVHPAFVSQKEVVAALENRHLYVEKYAEVYGEKVSFISGGLAEVGVMNYTPNGGFYGIMELSFMKDVPLSEKTKDAVKQFFGDKAEGIIAENDGKVGNNSFLASIELANRTGVFSVPIMKPNSPNLKVFSEDKEMEPIPLARIVPTLEKERLAEAVKRISEFKLAVETGQELPDSPPRKLAKNELGAQGEIREGKFLGGRTV